MSLKKIKKNLKSARMLLSLREELGLTQEEISIKLDISQSQYNKVENGLLDLNFTAVSNLRKLYGFDVNMYIDTRNSEPWWSKKYKKGSGETLFNLEKFNKKQ